eukprot:10303018-Heterocapsa_arctica.AAC.1
MQFHDDDEHDGRLGFVEPMTRHGDGGDEVVGNVCATPHGATFASSRRCTPRDGQGPVSWSPREETDDDRDVVREELFPLLHGINEGLAAPRRQVECVPRLRDQGLVGAVGVRASCPFVPELFPTIVEHASEITGTPSASALAYAPGAPR